MKEVQQPLRQPPSVHNTTRNNRLFLDSKEFQELAEKERMATFDLDQVRNYFSSIREVEKKLIVKETNMAPSHQTEFFHYVDTDQPFD